MEDSSKADSQIGLFAAGESPAWLGVGLLAFGVAIGITTGLSTSEGISKSLLTALFTFVGGVLLISYAGFRRRERQAIVISPRRVGGGLACFSAGVIIGVFGGIAARHYVDSRWSPVHSSTAEEPPPSRSRRSALTAALHSDVTTAIESLISDWKRERFLGDDKEGYLRARLVELVQRR